MLSRLNLRRLNERARREKHLDLRRRIDDATHRVNAEKERKLEARRKRVVVDDFTKRRQEQFALAFGLMLVAMEQVEEYGRKNEDANKR